MVVEDREKAIAFLKEGRELGLPRKAVAEFLGLCERTLRRWWLEFRCLGFSLDRRKGAPRRVAHKFSSKERQRVMDTVNNPRFTDLPLGQIVAILAEEEEYVASEMTIYRIM
jgi:transposase